MNGMHRFPEALSCMLALVAAVQSFPGKTVVLVRLGIRLEAVGCICFALPPVSRLPDTSSSVPEVHTDKTRWSVSINARQIPLLPDVVSRCGQNHTCCTVSWLGLMGLVVQVCAFWTVRSVIRSFSPSLLGTTLTLLSTLSRPPLSNPYTNTPTSPLSAVMHPACPHNMPQAASPVLFDGPHNPRPWREKFHRQWRLHSWCVYNLLVCSGRITDQFALRGTALT